MGFNLADMLEHAADAAADRTAVVDRDRRCTYAELDARINRLAHHLDASGIGPGDHVGIYAQNSLEWIEAMFACLKVRAVPVNINYRYVTEELRYLFENADLAGLVFDRGYAPRVAEVRDRCPMLRVLIAIDDGTDEDLADLGARTYDEAISTGDPARPAIERSPDDHFIIYTGGTTGMPKGVQWRQEDIFFALCGGINALTRERVTSPTMQAELAAASPGQLIFHIIPPLMHGAAQMATIMNLLQGNALVVVRQFDPTALWDEIERERINSILIVGDAMGRPLIETLEAEEAAGRVRDLSCLVSISSSAAVFSQTVKDRFIERFPNAVLTDSIGSTEGGLNGVLMVGKGEVMRGGGPTVAPGRDTVVLDDELRPVEPGSGVVGKVARTGNIPLGYYKDPEKTAVVFVTGADGVRYSMPGDFATVEADGTITLLGRGSVCINSGGEKVFPEEVEQALKAHPDVFDAVVVGVPDERWGQRVAAVVQARDGRVPTLEALDAHCRTMVASYKVPRELHLVDEIQRSPSGKPDYPWASKVATGG